MNIGFIISNTELAGTQRVTVNLAKWISNHTNNNITVITLQDAKRKSYDMKGFEYYSLQLKRIISCRIRIIINK